MFDLGHEKVDLRHIASVEESHEQIRWSLLFIDLMFVGVIYNTDYIIISCGHDSIVFFVAFCYFAVMFNTRYHLDFYASSSISLMRNTSFPLLQNDVFHRFVMVAFGLGIYLSTINISEDVLAEGDEGDFGHCDFDEHYTFAFAVGFIVSRAVIVIWNAVIVFFSPLPAFRTLYFYSFCSRSVIAFVTILIMLEATYNADNILYTMPLVVLVDMFSDHLRLGFAKLFGIQNHADIEILTPHHARQDTIFCNAEVYMERIGLIFMLVLGEAIIGFSFTYYTNEDAETWRSQIFAYLLLFSVAMLFYETVDHVNFDNHALTKGLHYRTAFYIFHLISSMFLLIGIVGVIELYVDAGNVLPAGFTDHDDDHHDDGGHGHVDVQWNSWLCSVGLAGTSLTLEIMRYLHEPGLILQIFNILDPNTYLRFIFRLSCVLHFVIYFIAQTRGSHSDMIIMAHALVSLAANGMHVVMATMKKEPVGSDVTGRDADAGSSSGIASRPTDIGGHKHSAGGRMSVFLAWDERRSSLMSQVRPDMEMGGRRSVTHTNPLRTSQPLTDRTASANSVPLLGKGSITSVDSSSSGRRTSTATTVHNPMEGKESLPPIREERDVSTDNRMDSSASATAPYILMDR